MMNTSAATVLSSAPATRPGHARLVRWSLRTVGVGVLLTAAIGALHLPFAAPLLRRLMPGGLCPVTRGTPAQIERAHAIAAAAIRATAERAAPTRPALGFALDQTHRTDVDAWASAHGISCGSINGNENLRRCQNVAAADLGLPSALGPLEEITFELNAAGVVVDVQTLRRGLSPEQAARVVATLEARAAEALGAPDQHGGSPTAAHLGRSFLATYVATHTFHDYRATISATNLAPTGIMLREEYLSTR